MEVVERGLLHAAVPGGPRRWGAWPSVTPLRDGSLLAGYVVGSGKDTDDQAIELRRSIDGGRTWSEPERPFSMVVDGVRGSFKGCPITPLRGDRLIMAALWVDREAFPGAPTPLTSRQRGWLTTALDACASPHASDDRVVAARIAGALVERAVQAALRA